MRELRKKRNSIDDNREAEDPSSAADGLSRQSLPDIPAWLAYLGAVIAGWLPFIHMWPKLAASYLGHPLCDMKLTYRHWIRFTMRAVREGEIPLWNPYIFCGQPYMPSTHGTLFYPPNWPFLFGFDQPLAINLILLTQVAILALGTVYYCRTRGTSNIAALFAGVMAAMGSLLTCRVFVGHFTIMCTAPWIPIMFALQEKLFQGHWRYWVIFAFAGACMFMGGHLQYAYYYGMFLALSVLLYGLCSVDGKERLQWYMRQAGLHAAAAILALLIVAVEALPDINVAMNSVRGGSKNVQWLREFAMPPENLVTLLAPKFFGSGIEYWGRWEWWEACFYFSVPGLALCLTTITMQYMRRRPSHLAIMFPLMIILAIAGFLPLLPHIVRWIPGWIMFRGHNRTLSFGLIFGVVLAAQGLDALRTGSGSARRWALGWLGIFVVFCGILALSATDDFWRSILTNPVRNRELFNTNPLSKPELFAAAVETARGSALMALGWSVLAFALVILTRRFPIHLWTWGAVGLVTVEMLFFSTPKVTFVENGIDIVPPETAAYFRSEKDRWRSGAARMINEGTSLEIPSIEGDDIVITKYYNTFACAYLNLPRVSPQLTMFLQGESPVLDAANLGYISASPDSGAVKSGQYQFVDLFDGNSAVIRRPGALPRAYVVTKAKMVGRDEASILAALRNIDFHREVLLATDDPFPKEILEKSEKLLQVPAVPAKVDYKGLHEVTVQAPAEGFLVLVDGYYPHWKATINGNASPIYRANSAFRAVWVEKGDTVVFRYENNLFYVGAWISAITIGCTLLGGAFWFFLRRNRVQGQPA